MPPKFLKHFDCIQCSIHCQYLPPIYIFLHTLVRGLKLLLRLGWRSSEFRNFSDQKIRPLCNQDRLRRRSGIHKSFIKSMVGHKIMSLLSNGAKISGSWKPQNSSCVPLKYMTNLLFWGVETFEYFTGL